jgi:FKBP-type peptidyl-prolyl cis-trans isomerase (trigger factor)
MLKKTNKLDKSMVEMLFEIPAEVWVARETEAVEFLGKDVEIDGFRKGKAPMEVLAKHFPEIMILEKMAELVISEMYPKVIAEEKIPAIGHPEVSITKLARGNALEFTVKTAVIPEVKLPDYKKIAKEEWKDESEEVTDADLDKAILDIRRMRAHQKMHDDNIPHEAHDHNEIKEADLPELNEEFIKTLGNFASVEEFKEKLRDNLKVEKKVENKNKNRSKIVERISAETKVDVPDILVDSELNKMLMQLKETIERAGMGFDDYSKHIGKTEEDMKKDFLPDAQKRAAMELALFEIGRQEKLNPSEEVINAEVDKLLAQYPGADRNRAIAYIEQVMTNEAVFEFLEKNVK